MERNKITIFDGDGWVVVHVNGRRVRSGHEITYSDWVHILHTFGVDVEVRFGEFGDGYDGDDTLFNGKKID